ncbi:MAG TPA: hypothetical protein VIB47_04425 [Dehalococcoidia bacterium]
MSRLFSRREFLKRGAVLGAFAAGFGGIEVARKAADLYEQHAAWSEASRPNREFFERHAAELERLTLGGSFAPEQWPPDGAGQRRALDGLGLAVRELGMKQLRLGLRWSRVAAGRGVDLAPYRPVLDACFEKGVDVCLNVGPVRVFRWPEEHVPPGIELAAHGATIGLGLPLAEAGLAYTERLLAALRRDYGGMLDAVRSVQIENEPYFALGPHRWRMSEDYLVALAKLVADAMPRAEIMVTSAGRLNLDEVRRLFERLQMERPGLAGRLVSGFDFHYKTPLRDSFPAIRHFDQVAYATPFAETLARNVWDARDLGFGIEVSEAQAEPYGQFQSPGNSVRDFRFLLLRCLREVLDPEKPGLVRVWGVERLVQRMQAGELTEDHRQIIEVIQAVNGTAAPRVSR